MKRSTTTFLFVCLSMLATAAQPSQQILDYIDQYRAIAVQEMIEYKIPASITMAQGIIESGAGLSQLAKESNNHFGIKCHTDWTGEKVYHDDDEKGECFRKYDDVADSYRDHSTFLSSKQRYASLFELDPDDYKGWAKGLKAAGYATNPKYADMLINMIEEYQLYELDKMTLADLKKIEKHPKEKTPDKQTDTANNDPKQPDKKDDHVSWNGYAAEVYYFNRIPTITARAGDTPESIAKQHHIKLSLLKDYNDIEQGGNFEEGTKIYLQPKRKKGTEKYHTVKTGETMWSISRDEGVRLSSLYTYNRMQPGQEPAVGEEISLRKKRKEPVQLASTKTSKLTITKKSNPPAQEKPQENTKPEFQDTNNDIYIDFEEEIPESTQKADDTPQPKQTTTETPAADPVDEKSDVILVEQYHTVAAKETLYAISKMYGVSVEDIQKWNNLAGTGISIGQRLIVGYK